MAHKLLERQIQKYLSSVISKLPSDAQLALEKFLNAVDESYVEADEDRRILERAMNLSSRELVVTATERKRLEKEVEEHHAHLVNAAKMSELGRMASGIAHEINNPLAVIKSHAGLIKDILGDKSPNLQDAKKLLEKIEHTVTRIARIISGLRTFSRDGCSDPFLPANLFQVVGETLELTYEQFKRNNIKLTVNVPCDLELKCRATQISQVLLNLINNSCDAIAHLNERWIRIEAVEYSDTIEISLTDSGSGIDEKINSQMFQPFFTTKEVGKGTGLGLSISYGIAKMHGGELKFDETWPHTRFVLKLPKANSAPAKKAA